MDLYQAIISAEPLQLPQPPQAIIDNLKIPQQRRKSFYALFQPYYDKKWKIELHNCTCYHELLWARDHWKDDIGKQRDIGIKIARFAGVIKNNPNPYPALRLKVDNEVVDVPRSEASEDDWDDDAKKMVNDVAELFDGTVV